MLAVYDKMIKCIPDELERHFQWLHPDTSFEMRAISRDRNGRPACRVFSHANLDSANSWAQSISGSGEFNLYVTLNPVPEGHLGGAVTDKDIPRRTNLLIDVDPVRPADTNATDKEKEAANRLASDVRLWLSGQGFPAPLVLSSGNGFHLTYAVDLPPNDDGLVRAFLIALGRKFDTEAVKIDAKVFNPSRITKIAGTQAGKKNATEDRPLRVSRIIGEVPPRVVAREESLQGVVDFIKAECGSEAEPERGPKQEREPKSGRTKRDNTTLSTIGTSPNGHAKPIRCEPTHATPTDERIRRARQYLDAIPDDGLSRSGHSGHDTFFTHTCCVVNGFLVRDRDKFRELIERHYNDRLRKLRESNPARVGEWESWSTSEINHKFDEALKVTHADKRFSPGWLLDAEDDPREWNDPVRAAELFIREHDVLRVRGRWLRHDGKRWSIIEDEFIGCEMRKLLEREANRTTRRRVEKWERDLNKLRGDANALRKQLADDPPEPWDTKGEETAFNRGQEKAKKELTRIESRLANTTRPVPPPVTRELVANCVDTLKSRRLHDANTDSSTPITFDVWRGIPKGVDCVGQASWLAVENGIIELDSIKLVPHFPEWFSTVCIPAAFIPDALPPTKWLELLHELFEGDTERIEVVQELFGACLDRNFPAKNFFAFVGSGENGKSVVLTVLRAMLGERNVSAVPLDHLNSNRFASFGLLGKLANIGGDQTYFESSDEGNLKTLTGGDSIPFEQKGRDVLYAVNKAKLVFSCNTPPKFSDKSEGVWNRLIMVPFTFTVPADRKNPLMNVATFWQAELPGILIWSLAGLARLKSNRGGFTRSRSGDMMKQRHRLDSNPARAFLCETVEPSDQAGSVSARPLYGDYVRWLTANGYKHPLTAHAFSKEVQALFPLSVNKPKRVGKDVDRHWFGIARKELEQPEAGNS